VKSFLIIFCLLVPWSFAQEPRELRAETARGLGKINTSAVSPDGQNVLIASGVNLYLWNVDTNHYSVFSSEEAQNSHFVDWDGTGEIFLTSKYSDYKEIIYVWSISSKKPLAAFALDVFAATLSPDGTKIAVIRDKKLVIIDWKLAFLASETQPLSLESLPADAVTFFPAKYSYETGFATPPALFEFDKVSKSLVMISRLGEVEVVDLEKNIVSYSTMSINGGVITDSDLNSSKTVLATITTSSSDLEFWSFPELRKSGSIERFLGDNIDFGNSSKLLYGISSSGTGLVYDLETRSLQTTFAGSTVSSNTWQIESVGSENKVLIYGPLSSIELWDVESNKREYIPGFTDYIYRLILSPKEDSVLVVYYFSQARRYSLSNKQLIGLEEWHPSCLDNASGVFTMDSRFKVMATDDQIMVFNNEDCSKVMEIPRSPVNTYYTAFSSNNDYAFMSAHPLSAEPKSVIWNTRTGKQLFSPTIKVVDLHCGCEVDVPPASAAFFDNDSKLFAVSAGGVAIFDILSGKLVKSLISKERYNLAATSSDGEWLVAATESGDIHIWDYPNLNMRYKLLGHTDNLSSILFRRDNQHIVTGSSDGSVLFWELPK
jgi:WD40 repeat protein